MTSVYNLKKVESRSEMVYWYEGVVLYIVSFLVHTYGVDPSRDNCLDFDTDYHSTKACECVVFQSYGLSGGTFYSPNYPTPYKSGINCILYSFIGDVNELVEITFVDLDIRAPKEYSPVLKQCEDKLKIFSSLDRPAVNEDSKEDDVICGDLSSLGDKKIYSRGRALIMEFSSSAYASSRETHKGFKGYFKFLEKSRFKTNGQLQFGTQCSYLIQYDSRKTSGNFFSPRYPQKYPASSNCQYIFIGHDQDTVHLTFKKISLPMTRKNSCDENGDYIRVFDGKDYNAPVLRTFCSTEEEVHVFSTGKYMFVEFRSDWSGQRQGFHGEYTFVQKIYSEQNVADSTVTDPAPYGSYECNQTINSKTAKNGTIYSPGHPQSYPTSIQCQYDFHAEGIERIQLVFSQMNLHYSGGNALEPYGCPSQDNIKVYVYNGEVEATLKEFCGRIQPKPLMSSGRRMKVVFKSDETEKQTKSFFKIDYYFRTDFAVLGNGIQDKREECSFVYNSSLSNSGYFTSPNYNGFYPRNTVCNYTFSGKDKQRVNISFESVSIGDGCDASDSSDSISFSNYLNAEDRSMQRICGTQRGPIDVISDAAFFRATFRTDDRYDATGFKAFYEFNVDDKDVSEEGTPKTDPLSHSSNVRQEASHMVVSLLIFLFLHIL